VGLIVFDDNKATDGLSDFLTCLSGLVRKNSFLFKNLAEKTDFSSAKYRLSKISQDNKRHSEILIEMSTRIGNSKIKTRECKRQLSIVHKTIEAVLEQILKKEIIATEDLSNFLSMLESSRGAEQYLLVQAKTFLFMSKEINRIYGVDLKEFNTLLIHIAQEEKEHLELIDEIKKNISQQSTNNEIRHPKIKYQNPDAWTFPPHK